tara:strand:+ start:13748 stop:14116 length:369 start_codon:yes stop_codon:yes gene_type:complete
MKLQINITKDILQRSMMCGTENFVGTTPENCAIALAVRDLFPEAVVSSDTIYYFPTNKSCLLPADAQNFIEIFDELNTCPEKRLNLNEFSFEIDIPEAVIDAIGLEQVHAILENHTTMQLVS